MSRLSKTLDTVGLRLEFRSLYLADFAHSAERFGIGPFPLIRTEAAVLGRLGRGICSAAQMLAESAVEPPVYSPYDHAMPVIDQRTGFFAQPTEDIAAVYRDMSAMNGDGITQAMSD